MLGAVWRVEDFPVGGGINDAFIACGRKKLTVDYVQTA